MSINSCPNCKGKLNTYSRCFDCKQAIQWICYKCQWESNLRDHIECHKNVSIYHVTSPNLHKPGFPIFDSLRNKVDEICHTPLQMIAPVFSLVH